MTEFANTQFGFRYGSAEVSRVMSEDSPRHSFVVIEVATLGRSSRNLQVYVTKTGKTRVYVDCEEVQIPKRKSAKRGKR